MPFIILSLFITVPVIEIALFIEVGGRIGVGATLAIVILTAVIGTALLRRQGLDTIRRIQDIIARDQLPVAELFEGACLLFAGALLLTPGFMTDALGSLLFVPQFRASTARAIDAYFLRHGRVHVSGMAAGGPAGGTGSRRHPGGSGVIDGEFVDITPENRGGAQDDNKNRPAIDADDPGTYRR
ncbi:MAG: FxsA family protein [Rhodospirillaceae bacterium]